MSHAEIIAALGGASRLADHLGTIPRVTFRWASGRAIPPRRWLRIVEIAAAQGVAGVTLEALVRGYYPTRILPRARSARIRAKAREKRKRPEGVSAAAA